jgi:nucleotide-binding universal stress UspA family protein
MTEERMPDVADRAEPGGGVVVGDDGSASSAAAVRFAAEEARRWRLPLHVVRAWTITSAPRPKDWRPGYVPSLLEFQQATREESERRVSELLGDHDGLEVVVHPVHGPSAQALIGASRTADVVVVGSRGRGGFAELLLGSVAEQCVRHSACPVIVVPRPEPA